MLFLDLPPAAPPLYQSSHSVLIVEHNAFTKNISDTTELPPISSEHLLETFVDLVKIPSPSGQEGKMRIEIQKRLYALGLSQETSIDTAGNVILKIPSNVQSKQTVLMTVHMDVVPPNLNIQPVVEGEGDERVIHSSGDTVLSGDDKAAIAVLLEALEISLKYNLPRPNLIIPFTVEEEIGGLGAAKIDRKDYQHADIAIALDSNEPPGTVIYAAPQLTLYEVTVNGRSAHSGFEPEKGANAIQALTMAVSKFRQGRIDEKTTANVGNISGGKKFNIVPDKAVAQGEVRSMDAKRVDEEFTVMKHHLDQAVLKVPGTRYEWKQNTVVYGYQTNVDLPVFKPLKQAVNEAGLNWKAIQTNGGSDVNVFAQSGVPSVVLSGAYYNPHQVNEYVKLKDMKTLTQLLLHIMHNYAK